MFKKVTQRLIFDLRNVEKELDVHAVFETMNNRGKQLTILERLKNRLVYLCKYLTESDSDIEVLRNKINDAWKTVYHFLAKNPDTILDEDDYFISHLSLLYLPEESVFSYETAEKKIFETFSSRAERYDEDKVTYKKIENYLLSISAAASVWYDIHTANNDTVKKILTLSTLRDVKIFILAVMLKINNDDDRQRILDKVECLLFRNRVPGLWVFDERSLSTWARDLYSEEKTAIELEMFLDELIAIHVDISSFISHIHNLFTYQRGAFGYHRWNCLKYFLYGYDNYLMSEYKENIAKIDYSGYESNTIEHVLPQAWKNNWDYFFNETGISPMMASIGSLLTPWVI